MKKFIIATLLALTGASVSASNYYVVVPLKGKAAGAGVSVTLNPAALPDGAENQSYPGFDLKNALQVTGDPTYAGSGVSWAVQSGALPTGLVMNNGVISGTPTEANLGATFTIVAAYKSKTGQQTYAIKVGSQYLAVTEVAIGKRTGCGVTPSGGLKCWGGMSYSLGQGVAMTSLVPVEVIPAGVTHVSIGPNGSDTICATLSGGGLKCWGTNNQGSTGTDSGAPSVSVPTIVPGMESAVAVSTGNSTSCGLTSSGGVKCWGSNGSGALGINSDTPTYSATPVDVAGKYSGVKQVSSSNGSCVVMNSGSVECWGSNASGQLGDGTMTDRWAPTPVLGLTNVSKISVSPGHTCALNSGAVKCWGDNTFGQLGNNSTSNSSIPVDVVGLSNVVDISTGLRHSCAVMANGTVACWGDNSFSQLGTTAAAQSSTPLLINGISNAKSINGTFTSICVVTRVNTAKCWGYGLNGQLGNGVKTNSATPVNVVKQ